MRRALDGEDVGNEKFDSSTQTFFVLADWTDSHHGPFLGYAVMLKLGFDLTLQICGFDSLWHSGVRSKLNSGLNYAMGQSTVVCPKRTEWTMIYSRVKSQTTKEIYIFVT